MRIPIPQTDAPIVRMIAHLPDGSQITGESMAGTPAWDVELPDGVSEDEVSVIAEHVSNSRAVLASETIKYAIEKPVIEPTETDDDEPTTLEKPDDEPADEELV